MTSIAMTSIITTIRDRCRRCYSCVRRCPAKAIRVREGQAEVIQERCLACGRCARVCSQSAKQIRSNLGMALEQIATREALALLAPSFPAAYPEWRPGQVIAALRRTGFVGVHDVAFGADLVSRVYHQRYKEAPDRTTITSPCPAAVDYVQKYAPDLLPFLAPVLSPMAALGKALKTRLRVGCRTVFIGPCTAKMREAAVPDVAPWIDGVMTFAELKDLFSNARVDVADLPDEDFDPPHPGSGGIFPVPAGLLRAARLPTDLLSNRVAHVVGSKAFVDHIERLQRRRRSGSLEELQTSFFDVLFCEGCVAGPIMTSDEGPLTRKQRVVSFVRAQSARHPRQAWTEEMDALADLDLSRTFRVDEQRHVMPEEGEIRRVLDRTGKHTAQDELNCQACGYRSCREKAIAVLDGIAEVEMCLPYLIEQLQATIEKLNLSTAELKEIHSHLLQAEKLAAIGKLAAGVAHEINNPLTGVLTFSSLMLKALPEDDPKRGDLQVVVNETLRCREIVKGLLDFARQTKPNKQMIGLNRVVEDSLLLVRNQALFMNLGLKLDLDPGVPSIMADQDQLRQVVLNVVVNAAEAMPHGGELSVSTRYDDAKAEVELRVADTGSGVAEEIRRKLVEPFFTTKKTGTGLGLSIAYGIVEHHGGTIRFESEQGRGTTVVIRFPKG
jgi:two-component system, NtrC family, sensor kinase